MQAVRNIPYGIQQPAVSAQVAQLEEYLGVTLFQRRPFVLTPPGEKLYAFVKPFFANLDKVANDLQGGQVTVTASGDVSVLPSVTTGAYGLQLPQIGIQGQSSMVVL